LTDRAALCGVASTGITEVDLAGISEGHQDLAAVVEFDPDVAPVEAGDGPLAPLLSRADRFIDTDLIAERVESHASALRIT
jgi:hypothetical protein